MKPVNEICISVIILSYFHEDYISKAIDSVISQEISVLYEIVIGDDCSKDKTLEIIDEYMVRYPDIIKKVTYSNNVGTTKNLCECIKVCKGNYITLLAGDDYFPDKHKLEIQYNWLEENKAYIALANSVKSVNAAGEVIRYYPRKKNRGKEVSIKNFLRADFYPLHGIMFRNNDVFRQSNYEKIVQIDRLVEDLPLCLVLLDIGKVYVLKDVFYSYYIRSQEEKKESKNFNSVQSAYDSYMRHVKLIDGLDSYYILKYDTKNLRAYYWSMYILSAVRRKEKAIVKSAVENGSIRIWLHGLFVYIPKTILLVVIRKIFDEKIGNYKE